MWLHPRNEQAFHFPVHLPQLAVDGRLAIRLT